MDLNQILHSTVGVPLNVGLYPYQWLHLCVQTVGHQLKLSVRWNERNGAVVLKTREPDALMELHILQLHRFATRPCGKREGVREGGREGEGELCYHNR